jgi:hypothetical protein
MDEQLRIDAVNEVSKHTRALDNLDEFVKKVAKQFVESKLYNFPQLCLDARRVNYLKKKELERLGNPGGWSGNKDFKFDYIIPTELYMFMTNMIYRNFWAEDNERVWRSFMRGIMRGSDSMELLKKVRVYYGSLANQTN